MENSKAALAVGPGPRTAGSDAARGARRVRSPERSAVSAHATSQPGGPAGRAGRRRTIEGRRPPLTISHSRRCHDEQPQEARSSGRPLLLQITPLVLAILGLVSPPPDYATYKRVAPGRLPHRGATERLKRTPSSPARSRWYSACYRWPYSACRSTWRRPVFPRGPARRSAAR